MGYVVIVGGELHNKGAQAMTFTVVDEIKKKFPNKDVALFAATYSERDEIEEKKLNFKVLPWYIRVKMKILGFPWSFKVGATDYFKYLIRGTRISNDQFTEINEILRNADLMVDVSGYALSSQRGYVASLSYLYNIVIAKKFEIPMVLYPQSFGPFNYSKVDEKKLFPLMSQYLKYPQKIYAREYDGIKHLENFNLNNVEKCFDSVLQNKNELTMGNIYNLDKIRLNNEAVKIKKSAVAIIPNQKIMVHGNELEQFHFYKKIINRLIELNKKVYLIRHSYEDLIICRKIKSEFQNEKRVVLLEDDLSCIQIEQLLSSFDFLIASRYHSIIHAYKNFVPTLVFGWAIKYQELLSHFEQEKYLFDVRTEQDEAEIINRLNEMLDNYEEESEVIRRKMAKLPRKDLLEF